MKISIFKRIVYGTVAVISIATIGIGIASYLLISHQILEEKYSYSRTTSTFLSDTINTFSNDRKVEISPENYKLVAVPCDYILRYCNCDYVYVFYPNEDFSKITYVYIASKNPLDEDYKSSITGMNDGVGVTVDYILNDSEMALWKKEFPYDVDLSFFAYREDDNENGHEYKTVTKTIDYKDHQFFVAVDYSHHTIFHPINAVFFVLFAVVLILIILTCVIVLRFLKRKVIVPINTICDTMLSYTGDNSEMKRLDLKGNNEFTSISNSYNKMCDNINSYVDKITKYTNEVTAHNTELDVANRIQTGFLPKKQYNKDDYLIEAIMQPAKAVGGDFYDYFDIDDSHIFMVIADISDKGISAAMFMTKVLVVFKLYARSGIPLDIILEKVNNTLCEDNAANLFATAFAMILDKSNNTLYYCNAGHNCPYIINDKLVKLDKSKGSLLGSFENETYKVNKIKLKKGDTLFAYTDGVTEAINPHKEFYGEQRLEKTLNKYINENKGNLIDFVKKDVLKFSRGADRFDDMTMLTFYFKNSTKKQSKIKTKHKGD